uniref:Pre-mRNA polyadenylation factor Fip1 domain-containing protein n=1 Tax=Pinguiococcus pyrenoidosus TaxID=172671 RepID=A0A7R9UG04_9STRA
MNADSPAEGAGVPDPEDAERSAGVKPNAEEIEAEEMEEAEEDAFHSDESDEELTLSVNKANVNRAYVRASAKPLGEAVAVGDAGASGDLFKTVVATEGMAVAMGTVDAGLQDSGVADASAQGKVDRTGKAMVLEDESYSPELLRLLRDPRRRTAFDMDISSIETKPWEQPGADPADHFNFELSEQAWEAYAEKQLIILESREREKVGDAPLPIDRQDILELKRREAAMAQGFSVDSPGMFDGGGPPHPGAFGPGGPPRPPLGFRGGPPRGPFNGNGARHVGPPGGRGRGMAPRPDGNYHQPGPHRGGGHRGPAHDGNGFHAQGRHGGYGRPPWMGAPHNGRG